MTTWALLAPGPSATAKQAARIRAAGIPLGVVGNAFELAPWAEFLAATDSAWWRKYPAAREFAGRKYTMHTIKHAERIRLPGVTVCNSGVLALECAKRKGATRILLAGFDMHGSHFFGKYTNGLSNTSEAKRRTHLAQYASWSRANKAIEVFNCTEGSALTCFPMARLDDFCSDVQMDDAGIPGEVHGGARQHAAPDGAQALPGTA